MSLVSIRLDAQEDRVMEQLDAFCRALLSEPERLFELVTGDFSWMGHSFGGDPGRLERLATWMQSGTAAFEKPTLLSASIMSSIPTWAAKRSFGALEQGDRVVFVDLVHGRDRATIGVLLSTRGRTRGRVRRVFDPAAFVRLVRLGRALTA